MAKEIIYPQSWDSDEKENFIELKDLREDIEIVVQYINKIHNINAENLQILIDRIEEFKNVVEQTFQQLHKKIEIMNNKIHTKNSKHLLQTQEVVNFDEIKIYYQHRFIKE